MKKQFAVLLLCASSIAVGSHTVGGGRAKGRDRNASKHVQVCTFKPGSGDQFDTAVKHNPIEALGPICNVKDAKHSKVGMYPDEGLVDRFTPPFVAGTSVCKGGELSEEAALAAYGKELRNRILLACAQQLCSERELGNSCEIQKNILEVSDENFEKFLTALKSNGGRLVCNTHELHEVP
jgi:hypothetical protein